MFSSSYQYALLHKHRPRSRSDTCGGEGYPLARTLIRLTPVAALIVTPLRAIPGTRLDADQSRMGFATRVLLHLHGDDVTDLELADRIFMSTIQHAGLITVSD